MTASTWSVIVPVKSAANAKTRLGPAYGRWRPLLARAFALDTVRAVSDAMRTAQVVVVTDDEELGGVLAGRPDVRVVAEQGHGDLNGSIRTGLANSSADPVAVVTSDLPALTPSDLDDVLTLADAHSVGVVADQERAGTTVLTAQSPRALRPRFGPDSFRLHVAEGASPLAVTAPGVLRDVDLPEHLIAAAELGVGPATAGVLERIRNGTGPVADPVP